MEMEAREKQAATEHAQLAARFNSALERERKESQEEQERVRKLLETQLSNFEKVRGRTSEPQLASRGGRKLVISDVRGAVISAIT